MKKQAASARVVSRRARAVESFRTATEAIGELEPGLSVFGVTRGQFSMIDLVLAVLDQVGPAAVSLWTWTVAEYEVETLTRLRRDARLTEGRLIIDGRGDQGLAKGATRARNVGVIREWQESFGPASVRYVRNHAKIATVAGGAWRVVVRGSMNLNFNPRFEQFDLSEGAAVYGLVRGIEDACPIVPVEGVGVEPVAATGLARAWSAESLALFDGVQAWRV